MCRVGFFIGELPALSIPIAPTLTAPLRECTALSKSNTRDGAIRAIGATTASHTRSHGAEAAIGVKLVALNVVIVARCWPAFAPEMLRQCEADDFVAVLDVFHARRLSGDYGGLTEEWAAHRVAIAERILPGIAHMPIDEFHAIKHRSAIKRHIGHTQPIGAGEHVIQIPAIAFKYRFFFAKFFGNDFVLQTRFGDGSCGRDRTRRTTDLRPTRADHAQIRKINNHP